MPNQRIKSLTKLHENGAFDVVVVGGGVNGIGVYRDLSLQGLRVLLVERNDFCSGCSAAPSRMIHGGLRYLENGEFDLVRESLAERDALLRNAPHMVRPLPTMIPITATFSGLFNAAFTFFGMKGKPASRGLVPIKLGLTLYDWITRKRRVLPTHQVKGRSATRAKWPALLPAAKRSAIYYDAQISHPERFCIELLQDTAAAAPDCVALNYVDLRLDGDGFVLRDLMGGQTITGTTQVIVNATGAWLDKTAQSLGRPQRKAMVSGTKGSHLIIDNPSLLEALSGHMAYFENADGRVCIVFPYQGKVLAGATDIRVKTPKRVRCEPDEMDYILGSLRLLFPGVAVTPDDVVFSFSGIRPLPQSDQDFTGRISRGHETRRLDGAMPQFCMIGGKWTTFRAFAEQTTDMVLAELGQPRRQSTLDLPIGGGKGFADPARSLWQLADDFGLSPERAAHLTGHYGANAARVARFCAAADDAPIGPDLIWSMREILWLIENEHVATLSDIILRRTSLAITGQVSLAVIDRIAAVMVQGTEMSADQIEEHRHELIYELTEFHGVTATTLAARDNERRQKCA